MFWLLHITVYLTGLVASWCIWDQNCICNVFFFFTKHAWEVLVLSSGKKVVKRRLASSISAYCLQGGAADRYYLYPLRNVFKASYGLLAPAKDNHPVWRVLCLKGILKKVNEFVSVKYAHIHEGVVKISLKAKRVKVLVYFLFHLTFRTILFMKIIRQSGRG